MKNIFEESYLKELEIRAAYDVADAAGNEDGKETARAAIRELWNGMEAKGKACARLYREYTEARDKGNELLDLRDAIWDKDVAELIRAIRENGIERFTFSSGWSSAVETAWLFLENGCRLEGMIQINGSEDIFHGGYKKAPAYLFSIG